MFRLLFLSGFILANFASSLYAMPMYARQTGNACGTCHAQTGYPALNRFGRHFKAHGYTMMGTQKTIENPMKKGFLSLAESFNSSFVIKIREINNDNDKGEIQFPDEAALVVGGRVAENIGSFIEIGYNNVDDKFLLANFKLPIVYDVLEDHTLGIVPFRTDAFGPSASFEILNTGAVRNARVLEERSAVSAQQYIGTATEAQGLGLYLYSNDWTIAYSAWMPEINTVRDYTPTNYFRLIYTPMINDWDIGIGTQIWKGTSKYDNDDDPVTPRHEVKTDAFALDFQALGNIEKYPVSFYATYAKAKPDPLSLYNTGVKDKKAFTFLTEVAVKPSVLMLSAGYRDAQSGAATNADEDAIIVGIKYFLWENVQLQFNYTNNRNTPTNKNRYLFMLYSAF